MDSSAQTTLVKVLDFFVKSQNGLVAYFLRKGVFQRVYFCLGILLEVVLKKEVKITFTKIDPADLDSLCQELSNGGLKSVVTLLICW